MAPECRVHAGEPRDADQEPPIGPAAEEAVLLHVDPEPLVEVRLYEVPLREHLPPREALAAVALGVLIPLAQARFRVVLPAAVRVRVPVRRVARFRAGPFPPVAQNSAAASAFCVSWMRT